MRVQGILYLYDIQKEREGGERERVRERVRETGRGRTEGERNSEREVWLCTELLLDFIFNQQLRGDYKFSIILDIHDENILVSWVSVCTAIVISVSLTPHTPDIRWLSRSSYDPLYMWSPWQQPRDTAIVNTTVCIDTLFKSDQQMNFFWGRICYCRISHYMCSICIMMSCTVPIVLCVN